MSNWWAQTTVSFGYWVRRQRKALDLTQEVLAAQVSCSPDTIKKIERDERRPSRQIAERLADSLGVPPDQRKVFLECARGLRPVDQLPLAREPTATPTPTRRVSLPLEVTPFIGRSAELRQIADNLANPDCRLLTLVGMGGVGKTRLAIHAARNMETQFAQDVCYMALAAVSAPELIAPAILQHLDVPLSGALDPEVQLIAFLGERKMLLVLDNFEPLLMDAGDDAGAASLVVHLLSACPGVKLLVTSRERLNLQAEWVLPLAGLPLADDAVALFVESARRVQPEFKLEGQAKGMAEICRLAGGLPLAIELAAGWTPVLSCEQIADQLRQGIGLLATRLRDVPERHRSLQALFDQSWRLLSTEERDLLMKLSVFRGGFGAEAAEAVGGAGLPVMLTLVQKSLARFEGQSRYDLHELIRRYAGERLAESGLMGTVQARHFDVYLSLIETAAAHLAGPEGAHWFDQLELEQGNLRAALSWALTHADDQALCRLTIPLVTDFWYPRGYWREGAAWLRQVVARLSEAATPQAALLLGFATLLGRGGSVVEARPYAQQAYTLAHQIEDPIAIGLAAMGMSQVVPEPAERLRFCQEAITVLRQVGVGMMLPRALMLWGDELRGQGALEEARAAYEEGLRLMREAGSTTHIAYPLGNLGRLALLDGDLPRARQVFAECVELSRRAGYRVGLADWLLRLGVAGLYQGEPGPARTALQESLALAEDIGHRQIIPNVLTWLALVAIAEGDLDQAGDYLQQSLQGYLALVTVSGGDSPARSLQYLERPDFVEALLAAVRIQAVRESPESAARLLGFAEKMMQERHYHLDPPLQAMVDDLHAQLDVPALASAWADGRALTLEQAVALALGRPAT